jgi:hypothetical protein
MKNLPIYRKGENMEKKLFICGNSIHCNSSTCAHKKPHEHRKNCKIGGCEGMKAIEGRIVTVKCIEVPMQRRFHG